MKSRWFSAAGSKICIQVLHGFKSFCGICSPGVETLQRLFVLTRGSRLKQEEAMRFRHVAFVSCSVLWKEVLSTVLPNGTETSMSHNRNPPDSWALFRVKPPAHV